MVEEIQETLQEYYKNIEIEIEFIERNRYKILLLKKIKKNDIIKKSVTFEYKWNEQNTFYINIIELENIIDRYFKLYLEREVLK